MNLRSNAANSPSRRANWRALGLSPEDMLKPKIAVVNSSSELAICYAHLDGIAKMVKEEIRAAGGVPFEVRTAAPSDFITGAARSGSYILAGRDIIANDIEVQVEAGAARRDDLPDELRQDPAGPPDGRARLNIPTDPGDRRLPAVGPDRRRAGRRRGRVGRLDRRAVRRRAQVPGRRDGRERDHGPRRVLGHGDRQYDALGGRGARHVPCRATPRCAPTARRCRPTPAAAVAASSRWSARTSSRARS
jgi:hypothetical protein